MSARNGIQQMSGRAMLSKQKQNTSSTYSLIVSMVLLLFSWFGMVFDGFASLFFAGFALLVLVVSLCVFAGLAFFFVLVLLRCSLSFFDVYLLIF